MATLLLENITTLVTVAGAPEGVRSPRRSGGAMGDIGVVRNADVAIEGDTIEWVGTTGTRAFPGAERIDCTGRTVLPGSHSGKES